MTPINHLYDFLFRESPSGLFPTPTLGHSLAIAPAWLVGGGLVGKLPPTKDELESLQCCQLHLPFVYFILFSPKLVFTRNRSLLDIVLFYSFSRG